MDYHIEVQFETPEAVKFQDRNVFRIRGTIIDAVNVPFEVFLHKKTLVNPDTNQQLDDFVAVAGVFDLSYYPALTPDPALDPPFYRLASFDILTPSVKAADEVQSAVVEQLNRLTTMMKQLDKLGIIQQLWIPSEPTTTTTTTTPGP